MKLEPMDSRVYSFGSRCRLSSGVPTTTLQYAVKPPSEELAKTVAEPFPTAVTFPDSSTAATSGSEVPQFKLRQVASSGNMLTFKVSEAPFFNFSSVGSSSILSTPFPTLITQEEV